MIIENEPLKGNTAIPICKIWNNLAQCAWNYGCDWVIFLGDDLQIEARSHYRALYRAYLDLKEEKGYPMFLGCLYANDQTFPRFPTFPVIGRVHQSVFNQLIPHHRSFINQDLDPYLHRIYDKFAATKCIDGFKIKNTFGGSRNNSRYTKIPALGWNNWVKNDSNILEKYLTSHKLPVQHQTSEVVKNKLYLNNWNK